MSPEPNTSFVVIAHNEAPTIERSLRSITGQRGLEDYEVVVVDDGSTDGTTEVAQRYAQTDPRVRVIRLPSNRGRGHARSVGLSEASGRRQVAMVDSDIVLPPDWYARCAEALQSADAVCGTAVPDGDVAFLHSRFGLEPRVARHLTDVTGSNALYRREVFERIGFDPDLPDGEDVALSHSMRAAKLEARTVDGLVVRHEETKGLLDSVRWLFQSGVGASRQFRRYREVRGPDLVFAGWLGALATSALLRRRGRRGIAGVLPPLYLVAAAGAHVNQKFELDARSGGRTMAAIGADAGLLASYLAGRTVGVFRRG